MKVIEIKDNIFAIDQGAITTVGIKDENGWILFDTCLDESNARKLNRLLNEKVNTIFHTHTHADHMGGDNFFVKKYNSKVIISKEEASFAYFPQLEPAILFGGYPFREIRGKFLCSKSLSDVELLTDAKTENVVDFIETPGHSPGHVCYLLDKDILFVGDAVFGEDVIDKYKILYLFNPAQFVQSLEKLISIEVEKAIYCHKGVIDFEEFVRLCKINLSHVNEIKEKVYYKCDGKSAEEITGELFDEMGIYVNFELFSLINSTVKGYLAWLRDDGLLEPYIKKNGVKWKKLQ